MPNHVRFTQELLDVAYDASVGRVMGQCNCSDCRKEIKSSQLDSLFFQLYPELGFLPHNLDKSCRYGGTEPDWMYSDDKAQYGAVLKALDLLRTNNRRKVGQWKRHNKSFHYCLECGDARRDTIKVINWDGTYYDAHVCPSCLFKYTVCDDCGEYVITYKHKGWRDNDGAMRHVCYRCYQDHWKSCWNCGHNDREDQFALFNSEREIARDEAGHYPEVRYICDSCMQYEERPCNVCGEYLYAWLAQSNEEDDHLCATCYDGCKIIHPWEWKPEPKFKLSKKNPKMTPSKLMYGVELEIEKEGSSLKYQMAHAILDFWGNDYLYAKEDATIENGIEIVTHPFSWQDYRERRSKWEEMFALIKDYGYGADNWDNVGMHVHMSKNAFTRLHLYKFLSFMYNDGNRTFVETIAQRSEHDYAMWCSADESASGIKQNAKNKHNPSDERHSAVNLTSGATVEVRIFASTILPPIFHKNLEFLQSLYDFTNNTKLKHINVPHYWRYINNKYNSNRFRNLINFIGEDEYVGGAYSLFGDTQPEEDE